MTKYKLLWNGPNRLRYDPSTWRIITPNLNSEVPERRKVHLVNVVRVVSRYSVREYDRKKVVGGGGGGVGDRAN